MKNKQLLENALNKLGYVIGCYDLDLETLKTRSIMNIIDKMKYGSTDIKLSVSGTKMVCEVCYVDNEVDFKLLDHKEYMAQFN